MGLLPAARSHCHSSLCIWGFNSLQSPFPHTTPPPQSRMRGQELLKQCFPVVAMEQAGDLYQIERAWGQASRGWWGPGPLLPAGPGSWLCAWGAWESREPWSHAAPLHRAGGVPAEEAPSLLHRLCKQEIHKWLQSPFRERSCTGHSSPFTHCSTNPKYHPHDGAAIPATLSWQTCLIPL